ncbi:MAG: translation initiation factor IF-2 N-terminal domain-containing protein, partial [Acidobacteria bacterium]|nr:translation initiation factor IF-2 N-terminal domain-containing protein [Acidobacteriota bacterium]
MSKIRINDLARELEVKSKAILDVLPEVGVTEKKTHSSSLEEHEAEKVRNHFRGPGDAQGPTKAARAAPSAPEEIKTKIDLSHISKPGDVLKAIIGKQQPQVTPASPAPPARPVPPPPAQEARPA